MEFKCCDCEGDTLEVQERFIGDEGGDIYLSITEYGGDDANPSVAAVSISRMDAIKLARKILSMTGGEDG